MKVELKDIVDALETASDELTAYVSKENGKVVVIEDEYFTYAEDDDEENDHPDWMAEPIREARDVLNHPERYLELPSVWDIHEYRIMEDFCREQPDEETRERLLAVIKGKGAFRRFKDLAFDLGVIEDWYKYKRNVLRDMAIEWCNDNNVQFVQGDD